MDESQSPAPRLGPVAGLAMVGIATAAVVLELAFRDPRLLFAVVFLGINALTYLATRPGPARRSPEPVVRKPRRLRFTIWQIMAASVVVALLAAGVRASASNIGLRIAGISSPTLWVVLGAGVGMLAVLGAVIYACRFVIGVIRLGLNREARG